VFHKTTPDLQYQDQDQDRTVQDRDQDQDHSVQDKKKTKTDFLVSDRCCPKTDGLRPHFCRLL